MKWQTEGYVTQELTPYDRVVQNPSSGTIDLFLKIRFGTLAII
jgi:hypothetical protein